MATTKKTKKSPKKSSTKLKKKKATTTKKTKKVQKAHIEGNLEVHKGFGILALNPRLFPLPVVYAASRAFVEKAYILIDGDPTEEIILEIRPRKPKADLVAVGRELNNQLIRELENFHRHSLSALTPFIEALDDEDAGEMTPQPEESCEQDRDISCEGDPLGIMKPWSKLAGRTK